MCAWVRKISEDRPILVFGPHINDEYDDVVGINQEDAASNVTPIIHASRSC
jgi:hypothetical protein